MPDKATINYSVINSFPLLGHRSGTYGRRGTKADCHRRGKCDRRRISERPLGRIASLYSRSGRIPHTARQVSASLSRSRSSLKSQSLARHHHQVTRASERRNALETMTGAMMIPACILEFAGSLVCYWLK